VGLGGVVVLALILALLVYILLAEKTFSRRKPSGDDLFAALPKAGVVLEKAPQVVESQAPPWQAALGQKLQAEGYRLVGDYSYAAAQFFWARVFLAPDAKSALLLVNWVEGMDKGKQIIPNLEIYSFDNKGSFILTACAQDGATRLLTGANRPTDEQLSLHLKAVYAESAARPILEEHQRRLAEWEAKGARVRELTPANVLPSLSKIFS
jgi:hypothetical protein